jgi:hypothetical protein
MPTPLEGRIKSLVLEAFDTLFKQRDYDAAAGFRSPGSGPRTAKHSPWEHS